MSILNGQKALVGLTQWIERSSSPGQGTFLGGRPDPQLGA